MLRNKKSKQENLRGKGYHCTMNTKDCWLSIFVRVFHNKHGSRLHTQPLQQLQRWVRPMGTTLRKLYLKRNGRSFK